MIHFLGDKGRLFNCMSSVSPFLSKWRNNWISSAWSPHLDIKFCMSHSSTNRSRISRTYLYPYWYLSIYLSTYLSLIYLSINKGICYRALVHVTLGAAWVVSRRPCLVLELEAYRTVVKQCSQAGWSPTRMNWNLWACSCCLCPWWQGQPAETGAFCHGMNTQKK